MIDINLQPWRDDYRTEQKKLFLIAIGASAILGFLIIGLIHWSIASKIQHQDNRNNFLTQQMLLMTSEMASLKKINVEKEQLIQNLQLIQDLHNSKFHVVGMLDELVKLVPKQVHLAKITRLKNKMIIAGSATSNDKITQFMKNISRSEWLKTPVLKAIEVKDNNPSLRHFELVATQRGNDLLSDASIKHSSKSQTG